MGSVVIIIDNGSMKEEEGNVLFNDALKTFYLRLYVVGHMIKYHSDSERGNLLPPHGLLFPINSKRSFICTIPHRQDSTYHSLCYTSHGALAGTRNSSMGPPYEGSIRRLIAPRVNALTTELHLAPWINECLATLQHEKYISYWVSVVNKS